MADTKTTFGIPSLAKKTPLWARWAFRIVFILTTGATGYIAATNLIPQETKYELTLILKLLIDPLVYSLSKFFGEEKETMAKED